MGSEESSNSNNDGGSGSESSRRFSVEDGGSNRRCFLLKHLTKSTTHWDHAHLVSDSLCGGSEPPPKRRLEMENFPAELNSSAVFNCVKVLNAWTIHQIKNSGESSTVSGGGAQHHQLNLLTSMTNTAATTDDTTNQQQVANLLDPRNNSGFRSTCYG